MTCLLAELVAEVEVVTLEQGAVLIKLEAVRVKQKVATIVF